MLYFIFIIPTLIFSLVIYLLLRKKKKKMNSIHNDERVMNDLKFLREQLLTETNPNVRLEIMKKIEIISSFYN